MEPLLISWHHKKYPEPVFSCDFHWSGRLATAGGDATVKLWRVTVNTETRKHQVEFLANLCRHHRGVNCVRFAPGGPGDVIRLASASDDGCIFLWEPSKADVDPDKDDKEAWSAVKMLKKHTEDIYDLAWSPDGRFLVSGSIDNSSIVWDAGKGVVLQRLHEHTHYVQGVSWDPLSTFLLTQSSDRSARFYKRMTRRKQLQFRCLGQLKKRSTKSIVAASNPGATEGDTAPPVFTHNYFRDENISTFFRRMDWSPDGRVAVLPTGQFVEEGNEKIANACYIFSRFDLENPALVLPFPGHRAVVAVRFSPRLYKHRPDTDSVACSPLLPDIPYRMIFAVATLDGVFIMDTSCNAPVAFVDQLHYATLTDMSWNVDGSMLCISSKDGYCSFLSFENEELGALFSPEEQEDVVRELQDKESLAVLTKHERRKVLRKRLLPSDEGSSSSPSSEDEAETGGSELPSSVAETSGSDGSLKRTAVVMEATATSTKSTEEGPEKKRQKGERKRIQPSIVSPLS